jgi:hypothetical protein
LSGRYTRGSGVCGAVGREVGLEARIETDAEARLETGPEERVGGGGGIERIGRGAAQPGGGQAYLVLVGVELVLFGAVAPGVVDQLPEGEGGAVGKQVGMPVGLAMQSRTVVRGTQ